MTNADTTTSTHLRQIELDRLLGGEKQGLEGARSHLEECATCRREFERQQQEQQAYVEPRAQAASAKLVSLAAQRVQTRHSSRRLSAIAGMAAAVAVILVFTILLSRREPLPPYAFSVSHGSQAFRNGNLSDSDVPRFGPHSRLRIDLKPATAVKTSLETQVWAAQQDRLQRLNLSAKASTDGALRLEGVLEEDFSIPAGRYTLWIFIFQPGDPKDAAIIRSAIKRGSLPEGEGVLLKTQVIFDEKKEDRNPTPPALD